MIGILLLVTGPFGGSVSTRVERVLAHVGTLGRRVQVAATAVGSPPMIIAATDGSELAHEALRAGLALMPPEEPVLLVTVVPHGDPTLVYGSGMAGGTMSEVEYEQLEQRHITAADRDLAEAVTALGIAHAETLVRRGDAAREICELAAEREARAIVIGSRGHGGIKRAVLGSVSDQILRHAPCTVVVTRPAD
jgi:nucleotide-binding universal stress UspA family protein